MQIDKIGERADGTLVGEDANGGLYTGTQKQVTWHEITREVREDNGFWVIEYLYGGQVHSKATIEVGSTMTLPNGQEVLCYDPDNDPGLIPPGKKNVTLPTGEVVEYEPTVTVVDWEAM